MLRGAVITVQTTAFQASMPQLINGINYSVLRETIRVWQISMPKQGPQTTQAFALIPL